MVECRTADPGQCVMALLARFRKPRIYVVDGLRILVVGLVARYAIRIERRERAAAVVHVTTLACDLHMRAEERKLCCGVHVEIPNVDEP